MLKIKGMSLDFMRYNNFLFKKEPLQIISDFNLEVKKGGITAIIGSSGSGKSLLAHSLVGILPSNVRRKGEILYKGKDLTESRQKKLRGKEIVLIPQTVNYLNPLKTVGGQVYRSAWRSHGNEAGDYCNMAFERYNLKMQDKKLYPFQISGGMARRVLTAIATVSKAELIIADEPTTGLDPKAIDETFKSLREIANEGKAVIVITHDVKKVSKYADSLAVFYGGTTVEVAQPEDFKNKENLRHPYTREIFSSMPENDFLFTPGLHPFGDMIKNGCIFQDRCSQKGEDCTIKKPEFKYYKKGWVSCHHA